MYAAGKTHPYKESCAWTMTEIAKRRLSVVIDTEIIKEDLYRFGGLRKWEIAVRMSENLLELVPDVLPVTKADARNTVRLLESYGPAGIPVRDLIHVGVMQNHEINKIISTDSHFDQVEGVERLDPKEIFEGQS